MEFIVDGFGDVRNHARVVAQDVEGSDFTLASFGQAFPHIGPIEVKHFAIARAVENATHGEFERARVDVADDGNAISQVEVELPGEIAADDAAGTIVDEGLLLIFGDLELAINAKELLRFDAEAGEEVLGVAGILVNAVEPLRIHDLLHAGNLGNALLVIQRYGEGQRYAIAGDQAQGLLRSGIAKVEGMIDGNEDAKQTHGYADAGDRKRGAAAVAPAVLDD